MARWPASIYTSHLSLSGIEITGRTSRPRRLNRRCQPARAQVAETSSSTPLDLLFQQLSAMKLEMADLKTSMQKEISELRRPRDNQYRRNHSRSRTLSRSRNRPDVCWYHNKFESDAQKCTQPCNCSAGNDPGRRSWRPTLFARRRTASSSSIGILKFNS